MQASCRRETRRFCLSFRDAPTGRRVAPPDDRPRTQARNPSGRRLKLWREVKAKNPKSGRKMSYIEMPTWPPTYRFLASYCAHMGQLDEARDIIARLRAITPIVIPNAEHWRII